MSVEFSESGRHLRIDALGVEVDGQFIAWDEVGAFGILGNAGRKGSRHGGQLAGPVPGLPLGCLAVCVQGDVDVVPAFGLMLDCLWLRPSDSERQKAIEMLQREMGDLWAKVPAFAPANVQVEDWWRSQVYGPRSRARTDEERVKELRSEIAEMNDDLRH